jgi:hypothetical protein
MTINRLFRLAVARSIGIGEMLRAGTAGRVIISKHPKFQRPVQHLSADDAGMEKGSILMEFHFYDTVRAGSKSTHFHRFAGEQINIY